MIKEKEKGNAVKLQKHKLYINVQLYQEKPTAAAEDPRGSRGIIKGSFLKHQWFM